MLKIIREELTKNPDVFVETEEYPDSLSDSYGVTFFVAPKGKGLFLPKDLNSFARGLTSLQNMKFYPASLYMDNEERKDSNFKHQYRSSSPLIIFSEKIGEEKIDDKTQTILLIASRGLEETALEDLIRQTPMLNLGGTYTKIFRTIEIRIYPTLELAKEKYQRNYYPHIEIFPELFEERPPGEKYVYHVFEEEYLSFILKNPEFKVPVLGLSISNRIKIQ